MNSRSILKIVLLFILIPCSTELGNAQSGFQLWAVAGMNLAQIDGDALGGYDKVGLTAGLQIAYPLRDKWDLNLELLFSQKGSRSSATQIRNNGYVERIHLNYLEIPVYVSLKDWKVDDYHKVGVHAGLAYAYLFSVKSGINDYTDGLGNFRNFDLSAFLGAHYAFNAKWSLTVRHSRSFTYIYLYDVSNQKSLLNHQWTFRVNYHF